MNGHASTWEYRSTTHYVRRSADHRIAHNGYPKPVRCRCPKRPLTDKLRGRTQAPNWSRECTISSRTRGDTADFHGPFQRLLADQPVVVSVRANPKPEHASFDVFAKYPVLISNPG